jgi:hydrogenase nickel incorporation protein HypA/HybF
MHEFGIAQGLLETVLRRAEEAHVRRIDSISVDIGVLSGVEEEALTFAFGALSEGTMAEHANLRVNKIALRCRCESCGKDFDCRPFSYRCPTCGRPSSTVVSGKEMNLVAMEVT